MEWYGMLPHEICEGNLIIKNYTNIQPLVPTGELCMVKIYQTVPGSPAGTCGNSRKGITPVKMAKAKLCLLGARQVMRLWERAKLCACALLQVASGTWVYVDEQVPSSDNVSVKATARWAAPQAARAPESGQRQPSPPIPRLD